MVKKRSKTGKEAAAGGADVGAAEGAVATGGGAIDRADVGVAEGAGATGKSDKNGKKGKKK
jgi:hypothetical protein